jgi:hypothetical protein
MVIQIKLSTPHVSLYLVSHSNIKSDLPSIVVRLERPCLLCLGYLLYGLLLASCTTGLCCAQASVGRRALPRWIGTCIQLPAVQCSRSKLARTLVTYLFLPRAGGPPTVRVESLACLDHHHHRKETAPAVDLYSRLFPSLGTRPAWRRDPSESWMMTNLVNKMCRSDPSR